MRPGFRVLADLTCLESMDPSGAPYIGSVMDLCVTKEVEHVVRVIPDPRRDIGINIMSYFRYGSKTSRCMASGRFSHIVALELIQGNYSRASFANLPIWRLNRSVKSLWLEFN
jgi:hypothetical protein